MEQKAESRIIAKLNCQNNLVNGGILVLSADSLDFDNYSKHIVHYKFIMNDKEIMGVAKVDRRELIDNNFNAVKILYEAISNSIAINLIENNKEFLTKIMKFSV